MLSGLTLALISCLSGAAHPADAPAPAQAATPCPTGPASGPRLLMTVTGARRQAGNITFTLYGGQPAKFLAHHGSLLVIRVPITGAATEGCVALSAPGTYAVAVYHDENDNHRFDRTLLGLPAEGYGFSNNAPALMGLPAFSAVRVTVGAGETRLTIKLRY